MNLSGESDSLNKVRPFRLGRDGSPPVITIVIKLSPLGFLL